MDWISAHARPVIDSVIYSILGTVVLGLSFYVIEKILPFSMRKEIAEDHNTALGIILGAFIIGLSIIIAAAIGSGPVGPVAP
jgi:putative membrane protein